MVPSRGETGREKFSLLISYVLLRVAEKGTICFNIHDLLFNCIMLGVSLFFKQMTGRLSHEFNNSYTSQHSLNYSVPIFSSVILYDREAAGVRAG